MSLEKDYDEVYRNGKESFHTFPVDDIYEEVNEFIEIGLEDKCVVDLGCGDGSFIINYLKDAKIVYGIDFSKEAICKAKELCFKKVNRFFYCMDFIKPSFLFSQIKNVDFVVSIGVIEHLNNPETIFQKSNFLLKKGGYLILEHPHFFNLRGVIWKTLDTFADFVMSKTDKHILLPNYIIEAANKNGFEMVDHKVFRYSQGNGENLLIDFDRRLRLAFKDKLNYSEEKVESFMSFIENIINGGVFPYNRDSGSEIVYRFVKK